MAATACGGHALCVRNVRTQTHSITNLNLQAYEENLTHSVFCPCGRSWLGADRTFDKRQLRVVDRRPARRVEVHLVGRQRHPRAEHRCPRRLVRSCRQERHLQQAPCLQGARAEGRHLHLLPLGQEWRCRKEGLHPSGLRASGRRRQGGHLSVWRLHERHRHHLGASHLPV